MKDINENSDLSTSTERQVRLYQADKEDVIPEAMEEIKISIVNDRARPSKRKKKVDMTATPCSKKLRNTISCSTPQSTSSPSWSSTSTLKSKDVNKSHVSTPSYMLELSPEWDDSLLEPSDNEDDSPLYLTVDEIDSLLEDDSNFAAKHFGLDTCSSTCTVTPESEDEMDKLCNSPCSQLDGSNTLTEETLCGEDLNNYAAMAPSPSHSVIHSVEAQVSNEKYYNSVQETNGISFSTVSVLDKAEALTHRLARDCSADFPVQSPSSLYTLDVVVEWNDDPELCFDGDIDDLLALSPGGSTSTEEETAAEPYGQIKEQFTSAPSDSVNSVNHSIPNNQTANSAGSDSADVLQQLSSSTSNLADALKVNHPPSTVPEPLKDSRSPSVVVSEIQSNIDVGEDVKPSTSTESDGQSTVILSDQPVNSSATQTSSSQETIKAPVSKSAAAQKSHAAVTPLPKPAGTPLPSPAHSAFLSQLNAGKDLYFRQVSLHIQGSEGENHSGPFHEMTALLNQIGKQNQNWKHPSDFSKRNYPKCGKKPSERCTLKEWEEKNGGTVQRFLNIPSPFHRNTP